MPAVRRAERQLPPETREGGQSYTFRKFAIKAGDGGGGDLKVTGRVKMIDWASVTGT